MTWFVYFCSLTLCGFTDAGADIDSLSCRNFAFFFNHSSSSCWRCINIDSSSFSLIIRILRCDSISNSSFFSLSRFSKLSSLAFSSLQSSFIGVSFSLLDFDHALTSFNVAFSINKSIVSSRTALILCSRPVNQSFSSECKQFSPFISRHNSLNVMIYESSLKQMFLMKWNVLTATFEPFEPDYVP